MYELGRFSSSRLRVKPSNDSSFVDQFLGVDSLYVDKFAAKTPTIPYVSISCGRLRIWGLFFV